MTNMMNNFSVVSTVPAYPDLLTTINSPNINSALRNFVKFYHYRDINEMIMRDQYRHYKASIKYLKKNGKKKAYVSYHPFEYNAYPSSVTPFVNKLNEPVAFLNNTPANVNTYPLTVDATLSPVSSIMLPINPQIIDMTPMKPFYYS